jgi:hypothetical protein
MTRRLGSCARVATVTVALTRYVLDHHLQADYPPVEDMTELLEVENRHSTAWLLCTFPIRLSAVQPGIRNHVQSVCDTAAVFPGTVGGSAVAVW